MKNQINCPICPDSKANLNSEPIKVRFRNVEYSIIQHFYKCESCKQEFIDEKTNTETMKQIPNYPI